MTTSIGDTVLRSEIDLLRHGVGDADALMGALRRRVLYVPQCGEDAVMPGDQDGLRLIYAFTTPEEMATFFLARDRGEQEVAYLTARGERLLDTALPALDLPGGVAVDVAGDRPMLFPGVRGVVANDRALDGGHPDGQHGEREQH